MKQQVLACAARLRLTRFAGPGVWSAAIVPGCVVLADCLLAAGCSSAPAAAPGPGISASPSHGVHASGTATTGNATSASPASAVHASPEVGKLRKILVIMEENHSAQQVFPSGMPYLWSLAREYGYASNWSDVGHPSLPNYLAIFGGSAFNEPKDCAPAPGCTYPGPSVFGQALALGETARAYEESMPQPCDLGYSGEYDVNHNPWAYFPSEAASCRSDDVAAGTPAAGALASDVRSANLPTVGLLTPNLLHDGHDGTLAQADTWLRSWIPVLMSGPDWRAGRLAIVVVFDEGETTEQVPFALIAPGLSGVTVSGPANQFALTRLIDEFTGAEPLREASGAASVAQHFGLSR
jgi:phosphatidylinositol-3-phosphatase